MPKRDLLTPLRTLSPRRVPRLVGQHLDRAAVPLVQQEEELDLPLLAGASLLPIEPRGVDLDFEQGVDLALLPVEVPRYAGAVLERRDLGRACEPDLSILVAVHQTHCGDRRSSGAVGCVEQMD